MTFSLIIDLRYRTLTVTSLAILTFTYYIFNVELYYIFNFPLKDDNIIIVLAVSQYMIFLTL